jgi:hypothetical protein
MLYSDLVSCFQKERELLMNIDLDQLWAVSKEKEETCSKVKSIQEKIASSVTLWLDRKSFNLNDVMDFIPIKTRAEFHKLYITLARLKKEVETLRQENIIFINDSLQFLDGLISIITGKDNNKVIYNNQCLPSESGIAMLLSKEV